MHFNASFVCAYDDGSLQFSQGLNCKDYGICDSLGKMNEDDF